MDKKAYIKTLGQKKIKHIDIEDHGRIEARDLSLLLEYCPQLESISLPAGISNQDLQLLYHFPKLEAVSSELSLCLDKEALTTILDLPYLKKLSLNNCQLNHKLVCLLSKSPTLSFLDLSNCEYLYDEDIRQLIELQNLRHVLINGSECITDQSLELLCSHACLIELGIAYCLGLTSKGMKAICALKELEILDLEGDAIDDEGIEYVSKLSKLKILNLKRCHGFTGRSIKRLSIQCNIEQLNLADCLQLRSSDFEGLTGLKNLTHLDMSRCYVTNVSLKKLLKETPLLYLRLCGCEEVSGEGLFPSPKLVGLDLSYCSKVDDNVLELLSHYPNLTELDLSGCPVTEQGVVSLIRKGKSLSRIRMRGARHIAESIRLKDQNNCKIVF